MRVGIDLGTTNSTVSTIDKVTGAPVILTDDEGSPFCPSVVCFTDDGTVVYGNEAKRMQAMKEGACISAFKLNMGDDCNVIRWNNVGYTAEEVSGLLIGHLIRNAEERLDGEEITEAVITVPAYFDDFQRKATIRAAESNGIKVLRIINEPTAAAIHYGCQTDAGKTILVYDLGGGTFDATIIRTSKGKIDVIATGGNHNLGGKDWDAIICDAVIKRYNQESNTRISNDSVTAGSLAVHAEQCKIALSDNDSCILKFSHRGHDVKVPITRSWFEDATRHLVIATTDIIDKLVGEQGIEWSQIDSILLVGGSTKMPSVREFVKDHFGKPVQVMNDSDLAVAKGAAAIADRFDTDARDNGAMTVTDVTAHSLGVLAVSKDRQRYVNEIMIKRNTPIPCKVTRQFIVERNNPTDRVEVYVLQGESYDPLDCAVLSRQIVYGFKNDGDGVILDFEYSYNENGTVDVRAYHDEKELDITTFPVEDTSWMALNPDDVASSDAPPVNIVFCVDLSRSMKEHNALETAKKCIYDFVSRVNRENRNFGLVGFGDRTNRLCELTDNGYSISNAVRDMKPNELGRGTNGSPFEDAKNMLKDRNGGRIIVLLTDGKLGKRNKAVTEAYECTDLGISIFSIGFGDADTDFLSDISNTDTGAIFTRLENMGEAFGSIATAINSGRYGLRMRH